jgi:hypothetical protein
MTYWTEAAIAQRLGGQFFSLEQVANGKFRVVDRNAVVEEDPVVEVPTSRWTDQELTYLVELKRQGKTHRECGEALNRTEWAIMDKWQSRMSWKSKVDVPRTTETLWLDDVARAVCGVYSVTKNDIKSPRRWRNSVEARQVFFWIARNFTSFSLPQIGAWCGGKDHSTVLHGIRKIDERMDRYRTQIEMAVFDLGLSLDQEAA